MRADLLKRLFRTMASSDQAGLIEIAGAIIEDERKRGHVQLAQQLEEWWKQMAIRGTASRSHAPLPHPTLTELPTSRRYNLPLVTMVEVDRLEHHMVLSPRVEEKFRRIEREYAARERLARYGLTPKKKVLLHGPPGCGKTLGAQRLAWNTGLPLLKVRFDALVSSYLGETASNLRAVFEAAEQRPCVLFLDECDSLASSRSHPNDVGEMRRIVNSLLVLLDEYSAPGLLVAATNLTEHLDIAIWRRFDDIIEVPRPGPSEIRQLIAMTLSAMEVEELDFDYIVRELGDCSAARVVKVVREAAKHAVLDGTGIVTNHDFMVVLNQERGD